MRLLDYPVRAHEEGLRKRHIGIGLNAGEAVTGHVRSSTRHDYTAIGDVTNVASRVAGLTKNTGYRIIVTKVVAELAGKSAGLVPLGPMAIEGHDPVAVYGCERGEECGGRRQTGGGRKLCLPPVPRCRPPVAGM
jgi:class 3 adenylate cyclase